LDKDFLIDAERAGYVINSRFWDLFDGHESTD
jgi:hypothetical protein